MEKRPVLLMYEDKEVACCLAALLPTLGYSNTLALPQKRGLAWLAEGNSPLLVLFDITLSGSLGFKLVASVREMNSTVPIIVAASASQLRLVVDSMQLGATDYVIAPFSTEETRMAIERALETRRNSESKFMDPDGFFQGGFTTAEMMRLCEVARMVSRTDVPVLITGESGVGKEVLARFIHNHSPRANKLLVKVNCAALPNDLLESELFGYERGAFTGATTEKMGKFELANGGTILLDEIGEMSPHLQAKLLHVLQDGEFSRLGGNRQFRADARILASTNRKLEEAVANGGFRNDLYFRLNVIRMKIPPLRERKQEIAFLSNYFIQKYRDKYASRIQELPQDVLDTLVEYDWPGNVRQLENVIKRFLILQRLDIEPVESLEPDRPKIAHLNEKTVVLPQPARPLLPVDFSSLKQVGELAAENAQRELVLRMLSETNWNRKLAARRLNICYKALLNKIKRWQIRRPPRTPATLSRRRATPGAGTLESDQFVHSGSTTASAS